VALVIIGALLIAASIAALVRFRVTGGAHDRHPERDDKGMGFWPTVAVALGAALMVAGMFLWN
jgi:hypothetical protein